MTNHEQDQEQEQEQEQETGNQRAQRDREETDRRGRASRIEQMKRTAQEERESLGFDPADLRKGMTSPYVVEVEREMPESDAVRYLIVTRLLDLAAVIDDLSAALVRQYGDGELRHELVDEMWQLHRRLGDALGAEPRA